MTARNNSSNGTGALALFSGGLDSTLACRVVEDQGIRVTAVKFITPFFGDDLRERKNEYVRHIRDTFGIELLLRDVTEEYLAMLRHPPHGYGKNFNPCVDCKILLLRRAREMMEETEASFLITGEVLGQRPMSQRRDTLRIIERDSGCENLLVRPLCARNLPPTPPEIAGLVDREKLLDFQGRNRKPQMALAAQFGITDYPSPAGGCLLTDPRQGGRIREYYQENRVIRAADIRLLLAGRQFLLPGGGRLAVGRNQSENRRLAGLRRPEDVQLRLTGRPGPLGVLRPPAGREDLELAARIVIRYGKRIPGSSSSAEVAAVTPEGELRLTAEPLSDELFKPWMR